MLIYLASPYTVHGDHSEEMHKELREKRFRRVCRKAAELMQYGHQVFCPIAHSHPIEVHGMEEREGHDFWLKQDFAVLRHADAMYIYCIEGWKQSRGIKAEIEFADAHQIPITLLHPSGKEESYGTPCSLVA